MMANTTTSNPSWLFNCLFTSIAITLFATKSTTGLVPGEITFLILSQNSTYHKGLSEKLQQNIIEQSLHNENHQQQKPKLNNAPKVLLVYQNFKTTTATWAIIPVLADIYQALTPDKPTTTSTKWLIICEEQTRVNLSSLMENLKNENDQKEVYFGYPLYDRQSTIIHHFAHFENPTSFKYPFLRAGVVFSVPMVKKLLFRLMNTQLSYDFFIDASHELATFTWNESKGDRLTLRPFICATNGDNCSLFATQATDCNEAVELDRILFAIKTCENFHNTRMPVVSNTWAKYVHHLRVFSNVRDKQIPTIDIGVDNTKSGHCEKTMQIFKYIQQELKRNTTLGEMIEWVVLADDDTILSVAALAKHLACYAAEEFVYLGERYGYKLASNGYNYITGGGGVVINRKVLNILANSCSCPSPTSPDDMIIATCLYHENIMPIHSSLFRQARPVDYPPELLAPNATISFHKHWQMNPYRVYEQWFSQNDKRFYERQHQNMVAKISFHATSDDGDGGNLLEAEFETMKNENNQYLQQNVDEVFKHSDL